MAFLPHTQTNGLDFVHKEKSNFVGFCLTRLSFDELYKIYSQFLHREEQAYFLQLQHSKRQYSYLLGRYCAKHAISRYTQLSDFTEVWIENGIFQHPVVKQALKSDTQISISHTEDIGVALAFSEIYPMAIDIENISLKKASIIQPYLSSLEANLSICEEIETQCTLLWTVKEALSKVLKCGLTIPFELLEVSSVERRNNLIVSFFKNFKQYKALSFCVDNTVYSLICPQQIDLELRVSALGKALEDKNIV